MYIQRVPASWGRTPRSWLGPGGSAGSRHGQSGRWWGTDAHPPHSLSPNRNLHRSFCQNLKLYTNVRMCSRQYLIYKASKDIVVPFTTTCGPLEVYKLQLALCCLRDNAVLQLCAATACCQCMLPLHVATACCHCMLPLHVATARCQCMLPLHVANACCHYMLPLHVATACCHCMLPLRVANACCHCMLPLHVATTRCQS